MRRNSSGREETEEDCTWKEVDEEGQWSPKSYIGLAGGDDTGEEAWWDDTFGLIVKKVEGFGNEYSS